ncbi:DNA repair protein XRCC2 [Nematostella vectensis]|uniref:DNA repair protein XRCC2 n=1 Tax=Nematostella vectensis TaxID=45351 RepID=UPI00138FAFD4|nr:DNA repair protein XRCC2 [Nematostella vectensis]
MAAENAAQLFSRLGSKQSLDGLDKKLFVDIPDGIKAGDVVEFYGKEGCGKTEMLLHLAANCIMPRSWHELYLGGKGVSVIFIDTDYHFQILRLIAIMEYRVKTAFERHEERHKEQTNEKDVKMKDIGKTAESETLIKQCLTRLFIVRCNSSVELLATLLSMEQLIICKPEICVMMIDSLSAFYWVDRSSGGESLQDQQENIRKTTSVLSRFSRENHLVIFTTVHAIFGNNTKEMMRNQDYLCKAWQQSVKYRYMFTKQTEYDGKASQFCSVYVVQRTSPKTESKSNRFLIEEHGVVFIS